MHRHLQFRTRENPASNGRHGSGIALDMKPSSKSIAKEYTGKFTSAVLAEAPIPSGGPLRRTATRAATVENKNPTEARQHSIRHAPALVERPLTCNEAASLIRAHPKTVKRMARSGDLPGHFRFGRWFFYASELDSWMRTELHSSRHSCRQD